MMPAHSTSPYIDLYEYETRQFEYGSIPDPILLALWEKHSSKVSVDFPTPKTEGKIQLTSQGWVGYIPCNADFIIRLNPKVKLKNLFGMLEYAYDLKSFHLLKGLIDCDSLEEFFDYLANILAMKVLTRSKKGFYRAYLSECGRMPFVRGRLDLQKVLAKQYEVSLPCEYEEHSADLIENQILAWTLYCIARSGACGERTIPVVRKAFRCIKGMVTVSPVKAYDCNRIAYNRLNSDYQMLHSICQFFLEHIGPSHEAGEKQMLPFLVDMSRLFELFVAQWLRQNLPDDYSINIHEDMEIGTEQTLKYNIDLVIYDRKSGNTFCVIDTKYKAHEKPTNADINQAVAYAKLKECDQAYLVYPMCLDSPINIDFNGIKVRSLSFSIADDLEEAGKRLLGDLFENV
jgi:5-methylcytosine-specific restriction enzyme subunit McrC